MIKQPDLPFVFVLWDDAWKSATDDTTLETVRDDHKPMPEVASGFVLCDNDKGIQLGNAWSPNGTWRQRAFIPRQLVVDVQPMKLTVIRPRRVNEHKRIQRPRTEDRTGQTPDTGNT